MNGPLVSVCIPTYNGAAMIGAAIESVLAQTLGDFELIVVDDGSTDDTAAVVARHAGDSRLRYERNPANLGPQGNWNRCLSLARGRYVKLLPHDDVLHPECLQRQSDVLSADGGESVALVFSARQVIGPDGRVLVRRGYGDRTAGAIDAATVVADCVRRGTNLLGEPGAVLFRATLARRVGGFDATNPYVIDLDYWLRLLVHGSAWYLPQPLASFRVWPQSWSLAIGSRQSGDFGRFVARIAPQWPGAVSWLNRGSGAFTARANNLARLAFYRFYVR